MKKKLFAAILCIFASVVLVLPLVGCRDRDTIWVFDDTYHWRMSVTGEELEDIKRGEHKYDDKKCTVCGRFLPPDILSLSENGVLYQWNKEFNGYCVKGVEEEKGVLTQISIPEEVNGYPVTYIGEKAFYDYSALTSVEMPDRESISDLHPAISC